jgi:hypothetical protein
MRTAIAPTGPDVSPSGTARITAGTPHPVWCSRDRCTVEVGGRGVREVSRAEHRSETVVLAFARVWLWQEPGQATAVGVAVGWSTLGASGDLPAREAVQLGRVLCDLGGEAQR